uniref:Uncharacterized protein n=1 Tax=Anguilla anguilla TaxID=7936 RepID=A0A0E9V0M4_ANGAN
MELEIKMRALLANVLNGYRAKSDPIKL